MRKQFGSLKVMSLKKNIIFNYIGRFYIVLISILILPLYFKYLGAAAFGLIGIYALMQSWFSIFNLGLTAALSREVAYCYSHENGFLKIKQLLRSLEIIFLLIIFMIAIGIMLSSHWIAYHWLKIENLNYHEVSYCIVLMGLSICFRFFADLYRAGISGIEQQVWLNVASIFLSTAQYGGGYILLRWITKIPSHFFEYQLLISAIEPILLGVKFYKILPVFSGRLSRITISWKSIGKIFPFASSIFYTGTIWILLSQSDKLILSHILSLTIFGYFALVSIISSGILQCAMPISLALLPRMTQLLSQGKTTEMLQLYRHATQMVSVIVFSIAGIIATFGAQIVYTWTGDKLAADWSGPILFWYALGNGFLSITAFQYYLQFAHGNLKLHVVFNTVFALFAIPLIFFSAYHYGAKGTAITWFVMQCVSFIVWPPIVHRRYAPNLHRQWILKDILPIFGGTLITIFFIKKIPFNFTSMSREQDLGILIILGVFAIMTNMVASSTCRDFIVARFLKKLN